MTRFVLSVSPVLLLIACVMLFPLTATAQDDILFTAEQAASGEAIYKETCQICHGNKLSNGQFGTPLKGSFFRNTWKGKSLGELIQHTYEEMPPDNVMSLTMQQSAEVVVFILSQNSIEAGDQAIEADMEKLGQISLPW